MTPHARSSLRRTAGTALFRAVKPLMIGGQRTRTDQFRAIGPVPGAVVFLGDSITEGGLWSEWFPDVATSNRGISGETTAQILARVDSAVGDSRAVFLLAGTNDLADGSTPAAIAQRIARILTGIERLSPGCPVFLQSVMPRQAQFAPEIRDLNTRLRSMADRFPNVEYVDLWPILATDDSALIPAYTNDSLHLNGAGYRAWTDLLRPLVHRVTAAHSS